MYLQHGDLTFLTDTLQMHGSSSAVLALACSLQGNRSSSSQLTVWLCTSTLQGVGAKVKLWEAVPYSGLANY